MKTSLSLLVLGAISVFSCNLIAATIKGVVHETDNKESFGGVTVLLMSPSLKDNPVAITEDTGVFSFTNLTKGTYRIVSSFGRAQSSRDNIVINSDDETIDVELSLALSQAGGENYNIIVTAQKAEEYINDIGLSIQAVSGKNLIKLGVKNTEDLEKIIPGFQTTSNPYGIVSPSIRGVGYLDSTIAGGPTVGMYIDEAPLMFTQLSAGATLDLQRVEVLKGPQGTLFGQNATGGLINYIAAIPTDVFKAGFDVSYGRFNDADISGFVSGPLFGKLKARAAARFNISGPWQRGYGEQEGQMWGGKDFMNFRTSLLWDPTDWFKIYLPVSAWIDRGYSQMGQFYAIARGSPLSPVSPAVVNYPFAPHNNQAAGGINCVNNDPFNPIKNQQLGTIIAGESMGPGSIAQLGGQPIRCEPARKDNTYFSIAPRMDFSLGAGMTLTSLTSFNLFNRHQAIHGSGIPFQMTQNINSGQITNAYEEMRLAGDFFGKGKWLVAGNYTHFETKESVLNSFNASSFTPLPLAIVNGNLQSLPFGPITMITNEWSDAWAIFAHGEYPILKSLTVTGGIRYAQQNIRAGICMVDGGDGTWAAASAVLQGALGSTAPLLVSPGRCATVGPASNNFNPPANGDLYNLTLNEDNIPWHAGINWKPITDTMLYASFSKGFKSGTFPTQPATTVRELQPAVQEALMSYEAGIKSSLLQWTLQLNGAFFYYDYTNKQILGATSDPFVGTISTLINIPKSHVIGFELSGAYSPTWLDGFTVSSGVSFQLSAVDASPNNTCRPPAAQDPNVATSANNPNLIVCQPDRYYGFDSFNQYADFTGQAFPQAPLWQGTVDAEQKLKLSKELGLYFGAAVKYVTSTNSNFVNPNPIPAYRNIGFQDGQGNTIITGSNPVFGGYVDCAGQPSATPVGPCPLNNPNDPQSVPGYALLDLRVGLTYGDWEFQAWGRNVLDTWYWTEVYHNIDVLTRLTGMPATFGATVSYRL